METRMWIAKKRGWEIAGSALTPESVFRNRRRFLAGAAGAYLAVNYRHTAAFPGIISSFYSKEFCSCYFVTEGTPEECHNFARQWVPIQNFVLDKEKRIIAKKLGWEQLDEVMMMKMNKNK